MAQVITPELRASDNLPIGRPLPRKCLVKLPLPTSARLLVSPQ